MSDEMAISQLIPLELSVADNLRSLLVQLLRRTARLARADCGLAACADLKAGRIEILSTLNLPKLPTAPVLADSSDGKRLLAEGWSRKDFLSPGAGLALNLSVPTVDPASLRIVLHFEWPPGAEVPADELRTLSDVLRLSTRVVFDTDKARRCERLRQHPPSEVEPVADSAFDEPMIDLLLAKIVERLVTQFHVERAAVLLRATKGGDLALVRGAYRGEPALSLPTLPRLIRRRRASSDGQEPERRRLSPGPAGIPFHAFDTGRSYLGADLEHASHGSAFFRGSLSGAAVPVILGHERLGVLLIESEAAASFGKREAVQLEDLARVFAVYLAKALTYEESKRGNARDPVLLVGTPRDVVDHAVSAAGVAATVLIEGESGTGKEMLARFIHRVGPRRDRPFLTLNCAEVNPSLVESHLFGHVKGAFTGADRESRGIFEQAEEGSVFIDEVDTLSIGVQSKLLRVLERGVISPVGAGGSERQVRARVIVATNKDLDRCVADGKFLKDLYYRLDVLRIAVPALRTYPASIPRIAQVLMREMAERNDRKPLPFTPLAERMLREHAFPGNVRELRNAVEHAVVRDRDGRVDLDDLPKAVVNSGHLRLLSDPGESEEARPIIQALREHQGNVLRAAQHLGVYRRQLYRLLRRHGIDPDSYRS